MAWPEILWGEVPAGNDPTDVFPWLRGRPNPYAPPAPRPSRPRAPKRPKPRRPRAAAPAPRTPAVPRTPTIPDVTFPDWMTQPQPATGAPAAPRPAAPSYAAPMPSVAPAAAFVPTDPELWKWVQNHYAAGLERQVYDKLEARNFTPPPPVNPWDTPRPGRGFVDFGPGGTPIYGPPDRPPAAKRPRKKLARRVRNGYIDFR